MSAGGPVSATIARLVEWVLRWPAVAALCVIALSAAGLSYSLLSGSLTINTDTANMISGELQWRQDFNAYRESFPARDGNIILVIDGETSQLAASYARDIGERLLAEPERFPLVFLGRESEFFTRQGFLYLDLNELYELSDNLTGARSVLARLSDDTSGAAVLELLAEAFESDDDIPAGMQVALDQMVVAAGDTFAVGESRPVAWGALFGSDDQSTNRRILLVRPAEDNRRIPAKAAIDRINEFSAELADTYGNSVELRLTGTPAMEYEELTSISESAAMSGLAALVMVVFVLYWFLRSVRLMIISVVTLLAGLCLTATFAALTVGELNLLSVAFAVLYVGLGVDFILHILLRLEELHQTGAPLASAMLETAQGVGSSLVICATTTAVGFFAFIPTDFVGISALGLIAGGGMIISLLVSLTLLPALVMLTTPRSFAAKLANVSSGYGLQLRLPPPRMTCAVAAVVVFAVVWFLPPTFDGNPINLRDPEAESVRALNDLATDSEAPIFSLAAIVPDAAAASDLADSLAGIETVAQVQTVANFVPSDQADKLDEIDFLRFEFGPMLARVEPRSAEPGRLFSAVERLVAALDAYSARTATESGLLDAARDWLTRMRARPAAARDEAAVVLDREIRGDLVEELQRLEAGLGAEAFDRDDLPPELRDRWINAAGDELVEIVPRENLNDREAAARFLADVQSLVPNATGLPVVYEEAAATVTRAFSFALMYAFVAVSLMLLLFLRSIRDAVLVMLPILFAALVTASVSSMIGLELNFANIIALPLLIGIGVDSGIHVVHRMRTEPPRDGNPLHTSTSRAVLASALTTVASFGNLAFASHVGMSSMGQLLSLGMLMSLVSVLVLLPALMRLGKALD
jgi:hopanoid biosynthesis associated RND transporter like protein HpnN